MGDLLYGDLPGTTGTVANPDVNRVRAALMSAQNINVGNIRNHDTLARNLRLAYSAVEMNPYQAKVEAKARELEARKDNLFLTWAQYDAPNAALARDDEKLFGLLDIKPLAEGFDRGRYVVKSADLANRALAGDAAAREELLQLKEKEGRNFENAELAREKRFYYTGDTGEPFYARLNVAAEQLPIMARTMVGPAIEGAKGGFAAASVAAVAGQAGPQVALPEEVVTVPGAFFLGFQGVYLPMVAKESYEIEGGSLAAELLGETDADGNPLSDDTIKIAKEAYGTIAATIEAASEGLFLKILNTVGLGKLGKEGLKAFYKNAVIKAAQSSTKRDVLLGTLSGVLANMGVQGAEEGLQETAQILTEFAVKSFAPGYFADNELFTAENWMQIKESALKGAEAGLYLGFIPMAVASTVNIHRARQAQSFAAEQIDLHAAIEETKTKQLSPERMVTFLENVKGLRGDVYLPADALLELYQQDVDVLTPLGFTPDDVAVAAEAGQDLSVPLSEAHSFLTQEEFQKVSEIMRASPEAYNYSEVLDAKSFEAGQEHMLAEAYFEYAEEMQAHEVQSARLTDELTLAIKANKNLTTQAIALEGSVEQYTSRVMDLLANYANRMSAYGQSPSDFLSKISAQAFLNDGRLNPAGFNYEELSAYESAGEEHPVMTHIKGRLDAASLRETWPGAYQAIVDSGNAWAFNREGKGRGVALDELADELVRSGLMGADQTFSADNLVEWLKTSRRPDTSLPVNTQMTGAGKSPRGKVVVSRNEATALFQPVNPGVDLDAEIFAVNNRGTFDPNDPRILYQSAPQDNHPRGQVSIHSNEYLIGLFPRANLSTLLHEIGHIFYEEMEMAAAAINDSDAQIVRDHAAIKNWLGVTPEQTGLTVEQKEQFARGFEAYLMEGKAPSANLEGAFGRFKKWLTKIYASAKALNVELTDEVRQVFDRMLAYDQDVENAARMNGLLDLTIEDLTNMEGMSQAQKNYAAKLISAAKDHAKDNLQQASDKNRRQRIKEYTESAIKKVDSEPFYIDLADIVDGGGIDRESAAYNFDGRTLDAINMRHGKVFTKGGADLEMTAAAHGYSSGKGFIAAMLKMPSRQEAIDNYVAEGLRKHDAQHSALDELLGQYGVRTQLEVIGKYFSEVMGKTPLDDKQYQFTASILLAETQMRRATRGDLFLNAFKRAWNKERDMLARKEISAAIKAGKLESADKTIRSILQANNQARLNLEMYKQSLEISKWQRSLENKVKKFVHQKNANVDARFTVMNLAMNYGLGKYVQSIGEGRDAGTVRNWLKEAEENGYELLLNENIMAGQKSWRDMTVAEFQELNDNIVQIMTVERNERQFLAIAGKQSLEEAGRALEESILAHNRARSRKTVEKENAAAKMIGSIHGSHTKIEAFCIALDGGEIGPVHEHIFQPIARARDNETLRFKEVTRALRGKNLFGAYSSRELSALGGQKYFIESIGESVTRENMLAAALNMGNEINLDRIKSGHNWTDAQLLDVVRGLNERDWAFVQAVWDYLETFKKEAFDLEQELTGLRPKAVEAKPFVNPLGQEMRGGYYPIAYDPTRSAAAYDKQQKQIETEIFGAGSYTKTMTVKGHLKARAVQGLGVPLDLSLTVATNHVFNVVHDLSFRKAILDVAKIVRNKNFQSAVEGTSGVHMYRLFMPWLKDIANDRQEPMTAINKWARWARSGATMMAMGYKVTTMLAQPLGIAQSLSYLGYEYAGMGFKTVLGNLNNLPALWEQTKALSPMMATRISSYDREIHDLSKKIAPGMSYFKFMDTLRDNAFVPMGWFQLLVDIPTWWGGYHKGMKEYGGDEAKTIAFADSVVRMSQSSGNVEDLASIQRGGELQRLFTMFYSYFNAFYNLSALQFKEMREAGGPETMLKAANFALLMWFVPAICSELVAGRGPDDDEEAWKWLAQNMLQYPFQAVVGVRDLANGIFSGFPYKMTPAEGGPAAIAKWMQDVYAALAEGNTDGLVKSSVQALGFAARLPIQQAVISVGNVWNYMIGEDPDFYLRDLFFSKPRSRK